MYRKQKHSKEYEELQDYYKNERLKKENIAGTDMQHEVSYVFSIKGVKTGRTSCAKSNTEERDRD